jgi:hypothetical protein
VNSVLIDPRDEELDTSAGAILDRPPVIKLGNVPAQDASQPRKWVIDLVEPKIAVPVGCEPVRLLTQVRKVAGHIGGKLPANCELSADLAQDSQAGQLFFGCRSPGRRVVEKARRRIHSEDQPRGTILRAETASASRSGFERRLHL